MSHLSYKDTYYRYKTIREIEWETGGEFPKWMDKLPTQLMRIFLQDKIFTVEQALQLSDKELLEIPNFGRKALHEWHTKIVPLLMGDAK